MLKWRYRNERHITLLRDNYVENTKNLRENYAVQVVLPSSTQPETRNLQQACCTLVTLLHVIKLISGRVRIACSGLDDNKSAASCQQA